MGLFQANKVKIEKIEDGDGIQFLVDYFSIKDHDSFMSEFIKDLIGNNNCLALINTDFFYGRKKNAAENKIIDLKEGLDQKGFIYREIITEKEADNRVFGIKLQKSAMVNRYQLGLAVTNDQIAGLIESTKDCNMFYYPDENETNVEEMLNKFDEARGRYEELNKVYSLCIYVDHYFRRFKIFCNKDKMGFVEEKLSKYK